MVLCAGGWTHGQREQQRAGPLPRAFDHGVELGIRQHLERAVDLCKARARAQQKGEDLLRQYLAFGLRESFNLGDE